MTSTQTDPEVTAYARQVREALADVPSARLEELLEDLEEHLVEVASETPGPLSDRLGPPAEYAAELRRAAGLPEGELVTAAAPREGLLARWTTRVRDSDAYRQLVAFLPELRPAWWVLRGWAVVAVVDHVFVGGGVPLLPTLGLGVIGWLVTAAVVVASVRLGLRARAADQPRTPVVAVANLALAACAAGALIGLAAGGPTTSYPDTVSYDPGPTTLTHEDGTPITNIVPYGSDGQPLDGVLLYDQDGRPIENVSTYTSDGEQVSRQDDGAPRPANAYPQQQVVTGYDEFGNPVEIEVSLPTAQVTPSAEPTATADPGVTTGPTP